LQAQILTHTHIYAVFEGGVSAPQLAAFNFDWRFKQASDEGCACMHPMLPPGCSVGSGKFEASGIYLELARTIYIRCIYDIVGRKITKCTVKYVVYIRFWPTLDML